MAPTVEKNASLPIIPGVEDCLCLICRQPGHLVHSCPYLPLPRKEHQKNTTSPILDTPRPSRPFKPPFSPSSAAITKVALCERCDQLSRRLGSSILESAHPFVRDDKHDFHRERANRKMTHIPPLGHIRTLRLLSTCPLCCLIFDITYLSKRDLGLIMDPGDESEGRLALVPAWTVHRLERNLNWEGYQLGKGPYAKCLYTAVTSGEADEDTPLVDMAVDAIGIEGTAGSGALGVRKVDPQTPSYGRIKGWFDRCDQLHPATCRPAVSDGLETIKVIDVETREIVMYPPGGCDYVALSYVWGGVEQPSYKLGDVLPAVPATLEDGMEVTRRLGKRYFWADSLCIDQGNDTEKAAQIALMSAIYTGAWATIINVCGRSARSGISRVGTLDGVVPQLSCKAGGVQLCSVMPMLSQKISESPWVTRAWTFQEGLLSPRRLFFTTHQVYFECNAFQCCESLDDSHSQFHLPSNDQHRTSLDNFEMHLDNIWERRGPECVIGQGVLRDPFRPIATLEEPDLNDTFLIYLKLVNTYTSKKMTQDTDSLNAFSAMLTRLRETHYKGGFLEGLPVEEFPRALLWTHVAQPRRRPGFPAWSWAGWEGVVRATAVKGAKYLQKEDMPPLRVWKAGSSGHPELVYDFNPVPWIQEKMRRDEEEEDGERDGLEEEDRLSGGDEGGVGVGASDPEQDHSSSGTGKKGMFWKVVRGLRMKQATKICKGRSQKKRGLAIKALLKISTVAKEKKRKEPVLLLAESMLATPTIPQKIGGTELLVEGITIRLTFRKVKDQSCVDSETERVADERMKGRAERCIVEVEGEEELELRFSGYNAAELISARNRKEQEFLLLARELDRLGPEMWYALVLIDWDGDTARKVGVASLRLEHPKSLASIKPERKVFKLTWNQL